MNAKGMPNAVSPMKLHTNSGKCSPKMRYILVITMVLGNIFLSSWNPKVEIFVIFTDSGLSATPIRLVFLSYLPLAFPVKREY